MNKCSVCKKEIPEGSTECGLSCTREASRRFRAGEASEAVTKFSKSMNKLMQPMPRELESLVEVPMIIVKHRWQKNKTIVVGSVAICFDDKGIAKVPNVGNNVLAVKTYCKFSKGLAHIVTEDAPEETPTEEPKAPVVEPAVPEEKVIEEDGKLSIQEDLEEEPEEELEEDLPPESAVVEEHKEEFVEEKPSTEKSVVPKKKPVGKKDRK